MVQETAASTSSSGASASTTPAATILRHQQFMPEEVQEQQALSRPPAEDHTTTSHSSLASPSGWSLFGTQSRASEAAKQLFCGGVAGAAAKTVTAPLSRLTILFQVHSMVTTKEHRPVFADSLTAGVKKIVSRGGWRSLWKGNLTSVLHRFPYSAMNFYVYEHTLDALAGAHPHHHPQTARVTEERNETHGQLVRRVTKMVMKPNPQDGEEDEEYDDEVRHPPSSGSWNPTSLASSSSAATSSSSSTTAASPPFSSSSWRSRAAPTTSRRPPPQAHRNKMEDTPASHKFVAGALAGTVACLACYPLDLVRTRLTTELEGQEHYRGIVDAFSKIYRTEGVRGFYSGVGPTLGVAVPNFAISYTVYGTLKEYTLDDELFYNLRKIDADSGEPKLGFLLTLLCGAASGILATLVTFPMDTIRRRMQIQSLHVAAGSDRLLTAGQQWSRLVRKEGLTSLYRGLTPEIIKVVPMVGTMFVVYEGTKDLLNVRHDRTR